MRFVLPASRHPQSLLARIATTAVAVICLGALIVFGALALAILLVGGIVWFIWFRWRLYRLRRQAEAADSSAQDQPDVIEGEYVVIREHRDQVH